MNRVLYSTDISSACGVVIAPRRMKKRYAVEDLSKTPTWLELNSVVSAGTPLTFINTSVYYKVNSEKARRLEWLAETSRNVRLIDFTPFCESIEYLYMTWRYVDRTILGYQHHYAFAGGHAERHSDKIVSSLDYELNAAKIAPYCHIDRNPIRENRQIINVAYNHDEHREYKTLRDNLFRTKKTPQPIVTRLADLVHGFESRRSMVIDVAPKDAVLICNLDSFAKQYRSDGFKCGTYAKPPDVSKAEMIVIAEPPIVYPYRRLHVEAAAPDGCQIIEVRGDAKVDKYLSGRSESERSAVQSFCDNLLEVKSASVSGRKCARSCKEANCVGV